MKINNTVSALVIAPIITGLIFLFPDVASAQQTSGLANWLNDPTGFVLPSWIVIRSVINILVIVALLALSFSNALRLNINGYELKKALPKLVIGIVLANGSMFIIRFITDISSAIVMFFVELSDTNSVGEFIAIVIGKISIETLMGLGWAELFPGIGLIMLLVFGLITLVGILWITVILYARLAIIYFLTVIAPLAFVAYGLPGMEKHFRSWWQEFIKWVFILPAMAAIFWLITRIGYGAENSSILQIIMVYALFFFALGLPKKMGGKIVGDVTDKFKAWTGINAAKKMGQEKVDYFKLKGSTRWGETRMGMKMAEWKAKEQQKIETLKERQAVSKAKVDLKLAGNSQERKQIELTNNKKLLQDQIAMKKDTAESEVLKETGLYEKLFMSEIAKRTAESLKKLVENETRMELTRRAGLKDEDKEKSAQDKVNEKVLKDFYKTQALANVFTEEVGRDEKMALGKQATENLQLVQVAGNHHRLKERIKAMESARDSEQNLERKQLLEQQIAEAKTKLGHFEESFKNLVEKEDSPYKTDKEELERLQKRPEYKEMSLLDILGQEMDKPKTGKGRVWAGQQRQSAKSVAAEIEARAEEFKYQTGEEIILEMQDALGSLDKFTEKNEKLSKEEKTALAAQLKQALMLGDTAFLSSRGIETADINKLLVAVEKNKNIIQNSGHIYNAQVASAWLDMHSKHVTEGGRSFSQEEQQRVLEALTSTNGAERKWASSIIIQSGVLGGINSSKVQNVSIRQELPDKPKKNNRKNPTLEDVFPELGGSAPEDNEEEDEI